jgi:hypothetical protein
MNAKCYDYELTWAKPTLYVKRDAYVSLWIAAMFNEYKERVNRSSELTYLLTPRSRVLLEKLTGFAACQEIPRIYGTRKFITVLTSARHLSLSWARSIQSPQPPPTSSRSILILSSYLRLDLPNGIFPSGFPTKTLYTTLSYIRIQAV